MRRSNEDAAVEPEIGVSMDRGRIVIRPVGHVDRAGLDALRSLLDCARAAGVIAVVDLAQIDDADLATVDALTADWAVISSLPS
jgi:hypothetical protein